MNSRNIKKIAIELLSHSTHFEQRTSRKLGHAIEALTLLSELEHVARESLKEAFLAAQNAMQQTIENDLEKERRKKISDNVAVSRASENSQKPPRDSKLYAQWIEKIKPEYQEAFKNPALFDAFLKIQAKANAASQNTRKSAHTNASLGQKQKPASAIKGALESRVIPSRAGQPSQGKPRQSDFAHGEPIQIGATVEKPGSPMRRKPFGTNPVLRPKRQS